MRIRALISRLPLSLWGEGGRRPDEGTVDIVPAPSPHPSPRGQTERSRKRFSVRKLGLTAIGLSVLGGAAAYGVYSKTVAEIGPLPLEATKEVSVTVVDREDRLLRAFTTPDGQWRLPLDPKDVDQHYLKMLLAFEDQRFYEHHGVDPQAVARAVVQMAKHQRLVSGGSTLTMQVARLLERKHERTAGGKLRQMARAIQLERALSKYEILRLYLRLAPFGGNLEGVRAATIAYFGKEPRRLSIGEAALLVALPQSPEVRRLDRNPQAAQRARDRVLDRAVEAGVISPAEALKAKSERVPSVRQAFPKLAPHLTETETAAHPAETTIKLTLDAKLQASLEKLASEQAGIQGESCPRLSWLPIMRREKSWRTSAPPDISKADAKAPSIW